MHLLDFIFPPRCVSCHRLGSYFCLTCQKSLLLREQRCPECDRQAIDGLTHPYCLKKYSMDGVISVFVYRGVVQNAIKSIKYRFQYDVAASLVALIPRKDLPFPPLAVIYPIPLHTDRLRWRGFNQAQKLGVFIARKFQHPITDGLLIRTQHRTPQADIHSREERIKNARGLFALKSHKLPQSVILFDDVWTTGSTMKEAAKVLKHGGVKQVFGLTIAR